MYSLYIEFRGRSSAQAKLRKTGPLGQEVVFQSRLGEGVVFWTLIPLYARASSPTPLQKLRP